MLDGVVEKTKKKETGVVKRGGITKKWWTKILGTKFITQCYQTELILNGRKFRSIHVLNGLKSVWHACYQFSNFHDLRVLPFF